MESIQADLATLTSKQSIANDLTLSSVESIIERLDQVRNQINQGKPVDGLLPLSTFLKTTSGKAATSHKEWSSAVNKFGKGVDKKFSTPLQPLFRPPAATPPATKGSTAPPPPSATPVPTFSSPSAISSLNSAITHHLARIGAFNTLSTFVAESGAASPDEKELNELKELHRILGELRDGKVDSALAWIYKRREEGSDPDPEKNLEFELRVEDFMRILLKGGAGEGDVEMDGAKDPLLPTKANGPPSSAASEALRYGGQHFRTLMSPSRTTLIASLLTSTLFLPISRLLSSPYAHLFQTYACPDPTTGRRVSELRLQAVFSEAYLSSSGRPEESALSVVTDVGGGGAMGKILKVSKVMKDKKTEWSAVDELPVDIPLPLKHRYHSIFACPVSKEQSTASNPPMLLPCGHVIARDSLHRLARGTPNLKCPYCPVISHTSEAHRVYF